MNQEYAWNLIAKKLSGEASQEELEQLEILLRNDPGLHYPLQIITDLWKHNRHNIKQTADNAFARHIARMTIMNIDFDKEKLNAPENSFLATKKKNKTKKVLWGVSSILALMIAFFVVKHFFIYADKKQAESGQNNLSEISTHNGSKTNVVLPDGTTVKLNDGSKLTYDKNYGNLIREVNLTGEAFFDVVKNKEKPFIIHTKKIDIKVLGTTFNVKSYPDEKTETSLVKGSIEVTFKDKSSEKIILKPNEKLIVADDELSLKSAKTKSTKETFNPIVAISHLNYTRQDSTIIETAWVQNKLIFRNETFKQLALRMERWYNVAIRFGDSGTENLSFTGIFENETVQQALDALQLSGKFNYSMKENEIFISK
ncbi:MAG TPA: FecR family protein [Puia sp.]|jgi:transmembrane sensor|nr:FecR family protein [Puia sp.]